MSIVDGPGVEWPVNLGYDCTVRPDEKQDIVRRGMRNEMP